MSGLGRIACGEASARPAAPAVVAKQEEGKGSETMSKHSTFCKHYRAMSEHDTCEAGVRYDSFTGLKFEARPCFERDGVAPPGCELAVFQTPEERAAREKELNERFAAIGLARQAIVEYCGGPWKRGMPSRQGEIDCPACKTGKLRFSRAGYNGHIHAGCTTGGCVRWME